MKVPNSENAVVDQRKLKAYCLDPNHPRGKHKARVFQSVLGLTRDDTDWLRKKLLKIVQNQEAEQTKSDRFGERFVVDFELETKKGKARVRSLWMIRTEESFPRFVSCYIR